MFYNPTRIRTRNWCIIYYTVFNPAIYTSGRTRTCKILNLFRRQGPFQFGSRRLIMKVKCFNCSKVFHKIQSQINRSKSGRHFCSRKCSANIILKEIPKRIAKVRKCIVCNSSFRHSYKKDNKYTSTLCKICFDKKKLSPRKTTIGEVRNSIAVKNKHPSWLHSRVRTNCSSWNKELKNYPCQVCGYTLHIELCHIKSIGSFDNNTTLEIVNSPDNLLVLCRNHHWEFDNNFLELKNIPTRKY